MADNISIKDGSGTTVVIATKDLAGVQLNKSVPIDIDGTTLFDGNHAIGRVGGFNAIPSANFTRPADTTAYAVGDLVANSTTAGSVTPLSFSMNRVTGLGGMIRRVRLRKSGTSLTSAAFRIHFYAASPTVSNGDNGAWQSNQVANYVGSVDVTLDKAFTDGASGYGIPALGAEMNFTADTYYAVIEARAAYTPASAEVFTVDLELLRN